MTEKTKKLTTFHYFSSPIYSNEIPEWVNNINKICDKYIKDAKKNNVKIIKEQEKKIKNYGLSYHSTSLLSEPNLKEFTNYVGTTSCSILEHMGYDLKDYEIFLTELWVQEFNEKGGGYHESHVHYDNHISGFYFLKCSDKTSYPIFHDPRPAKLMTQLPLKDEKNITSGTDKINYTPKPGTILFFPSYINHEYPMDKGIETFRFIHFNLQAVRKMIIDTIRN
jgi:uncharacterized protein (TIGR02466 family)